jgi:hypothetical protein
MIGEYETRLELAGEDYQALVQYELDEGDGANAICISNVILRRCVAQRGDVVYHPDGDCHLVNFPEYIYLEIFNWLKGSQLKVIAEEIYADIEEKNWNEAMNEPRQYVPRNFPPNFPGVRL